jgi:hypothetical protein
MKPQRDLADSEPGEAGRSVPTSDRRERADKARSAVLTSPRSGRAHAEAAGRSVLFGVISNPARTGRRGYNLGRGENAYSVVRDR